MKKQIVFLTVAFLSQSSLGNAVKFDPPTAGEKEFSAKTHKLALQLQKPGISQEEQEILQTQLKAITTMAIFKSSSQKEQVEFLDELRDAYDDYKKAKKNKLFMKYNIKLDQHYWGGIQNLITDLENLLKAQYNVLPRYSDENIRHEKRRQLVEKYKINLDPMTFMKMLEASHVEVLALMKDDLSMGSVNPMPEKKVTAAFSYADTKSQEVEKDLKTLREIAKQLDEVPEDSKREHQSDEIEMIKSFHRYQPNERTNWVTPTDSGFTVPEGIQIRQGWDRVKRPLAMIKVTENDVLRFFNGEFVLKTNVGTANYAFVSEPISIKGLSHVSATISGRINTGGFAIGFLSENQSQWLVNKGAVKDVNQRWTPESLIDIELPPTTDEKVFFVLTNNQTDPARSKYVINKLEIFADEDKPEKTE